MKKIYDKTNGLLNGLDLKSRRYRIIYGVMLGFLILISLICLLPIIWVALSAFKTPAEFYSVPPKFLPLKVSFGQIAEVWKKVNFFDYFGNTLVMILGALVFDIIFNGLAGYVISRVRPMGSALLETLIFGTMLLPSLSMVPLYMTFVDMPIIHANLSGSFLPLWLQAGCNAFTIMLFRNFFNGIPMNYVEAARIDGCGNIAVFFKIILPLSKPIIMVETIFCVINWWKNFMWPYLILGNSKNETISIMLYKMSSAGISETENLMLIMLSIIPPMILYAIFQKHIIGGLDMSGVKG